MDRDSDMYTITVIEAAIIIIIIIIIIITTTIIMKISICLSILNSPMTFWNIFL